MANLSPSFSFHSACRCSIYGSIRDDCDQSTGRCVCKPGIEGQKCQECRNGKMLGPGGCTGMEQLFVFALKIIFFKKHPRK